MARRLNIPLVATNDAHYHEPERRQLQDILTCIRESINAGYKLHQNAERFERQGKWPPLPTLSEATVTVIVGLPVFTQRTEICLPGRDHHG